MLGPFNTAKDLVHAEIEHKLHQYDINGNIDLSKCTALQFKRLVEILTNGFLEYGDYTWISASFVTELIKLIKERMP